MSHERSRADVASLAHGLAHEIAALTEARGKLAACCPSTYQVLDAMIDKRKNRVTALGAQVAGHA